MLEQIARAIAHPSAVVGPRLKGESKNEWAARAVVAILTDERLHGIGRRAARRRFYELWWGKNARQQAYLEGWAARGHYIHDPAPFEMSHSEWATQEAIAADLALYGPRPA